MRKLISITFVVSFAWSIALHAQSSASAQPANASQDNFQTIDRHKSHLVRIDPAADWGSYERLVFAPAAYEPSNPSHSLKTRQLETLRAAVDSSPRKAMPESTNSEGRVLEVRTVITDVRRTNPYINAISFAAIQAPVS